MMSKRGFFLCLCANPFVNCVIIVRHGRHWTRFVALNFYQAGR